MYVCMYVCMYVWQPRPQEDAVEFMVKTQGPSPLRRWSHCKGNRTRNAFLSFFDIDATHFSIGHRQPNNKCVYGFCAYSAI